MLYHSINDRRYIKEFIGLYGITRYQLRFLMKDNNIIAKIRKRTKVQDIIYDQKIPEDKQK